MYGTLLLLHVIAATVWTGGHLVLALTVLPRVLRRRTIDELLRFEAGYERIGIPALFVQMITGLWLAYRLVPDAGQWFDPGNPVGRLVGVKLLLLVLTLGLAVHARFRVIPNLAGGSPGSLALHIFAVTVLAVLFVVVGVAFRTGLPF